MPWTLAAIDSSERQLSICYASATTGAYCPGVSLDETSTYVKIELLGYVEAELPARASCVFSRGAVTLSAPLRQRSLLHAAVDANWKVALDNH
jgi:hypothetical protein